MLVASLLLLIMIPAVSSTTSAQQTNNSQPIYNGSLQITIGTDQNGNGGGAKLGCAWDNFTFTAQKNDVVVGNFTSDVRIDFYVVDPSTYHTWLQTWSACAINSDFGFTPLVIKMSKESYAFNYTIPYNGQFVLVLVNQAIGTTAHIQFDAWLNTGSSTAASIATPVMSSVQNKLSSKITSSF